MNKIFGSIAGLGLILGFLIHLFSLFGFYHEVMGAFFIFLHVGIFVVWLPALFEILRTQGFDRSNRRKSGAILKQWGVILKDSHRPLIILSGFFLVYALVNFFLFMQISEGGGPSVVEGKFVLQNHGNIIRELTETEYLKFKANEVRGFSGHWMVFYSFSLTILLKKKPVSDTKNAIN